MTSKRAWTWACVWEGSGRTFAWDINWDIADAIEWGRAAAGRSAWVVRRVLVWVEA